MKKYLWILAITVMWCCTSCQEDKPSDPKTTTGEKPKTVSKVVDSTKPILAPQSDSLSYSGYRYVHHIKNDGPKPQIGDEVYFHNITAKNDSVLLQSSYYTREPWTAVMVHPDSLPINPPPPNYEALCLMSPGDSLTIYQYMDTFPAHQLPKGVSNKDYFIRNYKMISIRSRAEVDAEIAATKARAVTVKDSVQQLIKDYNAGKLNNQLKATASGVKYLVHKDIGGKAIREGGFVKVHYAGFLEKDGQLFENTFVNAAPYTFRINRQKVIPGWDEAISKLNKGGEATLFIPYQMAYGVAGDPPSIPERANLVFFVSVVDTY